MRDLQMSLSCNLKRYRKEAGLTQQDLAKRSSLSFSMVSKLESGEQSNPSFGTLKKLADGLGISPADLLMKALSIEEQIDEYIAYKRGLNGTDGMGDISRTNRNSGMGDISRTSGFGGSEAREAARSNHTSEQVSQKRQEGPDINFLRSLSAINTIPKPADSDEDYLSFLRSRPELKRLFFASKNASAEEIERAIEYFESAKA
ncbi:helix-turn-helix transcriptional regulator [Anoxybacterium hadale]|uniref:Helix-turn-helix transcriptional regulator n=1 Tax=Anoxybacterium hadale TaxID=3408580 RepID=A0ACD1ACG0_9FIRM|nr:helix-turn-helix transcriptional regulator [Clostridiales bacterium]